MLYQSLVFSKVIQLYIYTYIFQVLFHYRLLQDTEYNSQSYIQWDFTVYLLYIQCYVSVNPKVLISLSPLFPFGNRMFVFYVCESITVLAISSLVSFFLDFTYKGYHFILVFLAWLYLSYQEVITMDLQVQPYGCKWHYFILFYGWVIFHCIYVPHLLYPFICQLTFSILPHLGYSTQCCYEHWQVSF